MRKIISIIILLSITLVVYAAKPIKTVVITGQNNHNWPISSEAIKLILNNSGLFDVDLAVSAVEVVSPFDGAKLTVMRPDGSFAFDSFNAFAARPSALIRAMVRTDAKSPSLLIRKLALDCRKSGERFALVELELRKGANAPVRASAAVPTDDGNYTRAFSTAFVQAVGRLTAETKR